MCQTRTKISGRIYCITCKSPKEIPIDQTIRPEATGASPLTIGVLLRPNEAKTNKNVPINSLKKFDDVSLIAGPVQNTASFSLFDYRLH